MVLVIPELQGKTVKCKDKSGIVKEDKIICHCCSESFSITKWEFHAGSAAKHPWDKIFEASSGKPLLHFKQAFAGNPTLQNNTEKASPKRKTKPASKEVQTESPRKRVTKPKETVVNGKLDIKICEPKEILQSRFSPLTNYQFLKFVVSMDALELLSDKELESLFPLLPEVDLQGINTKANLRHLLDENEGFDECLAIWSYMLKAGEFDPALQDYNTNEREKFFSTQDSWKKEQYEEYYGQKFKEQVST